ncbi:MAG: histidine phosphatase family protein [Chloroflexi bacterium]|nr:MAG: histidine phosphatase family protein [Chloroflexota bacterium]MBL1195665.1 histidine phosphatase family protein [Chloroflexota bacterium]NOH12953.1 histidine phosphatase family protein [Chloroflexota bacterium]
MSQLLLIRHSQPEQDTTAPASEWRLSHQGRQLCQSLAEALKVYEPTRLISSMEPKAVETAQITARHLGVPSEIAFGLHEHDRSNVGYIPDGERFETIISDMFAKVDEKVFGAETANQALGRFSDAVNGLLGEYSDESIGMVTHGTVMSLLVAAHNDIDAYKFWKSLTMPCFVALEFPEMQMSSVVHKIVK